MPENQNTLFDAYDPDTYHPDDIANGNAADAQAEDARRKAEDDENDPVDHCATCGHYREWHRCEAPGLHLDGPMPAKAADTACPMYTTERASDLIDDGIGLRARGGLVYFG